MKKIYACLAICVAGIMYSGCGTIRLVTALNMRGYYDQWLKIDSAQTNAPSGGHLYNLLLAESTAVKLLQANYGTPDYVLAYNSNDGNPVRFIYLNKNLFAETDWLKNGKTDERLLNTMPEYYLPKEVIKLREEAVIQKRAEEQAAREKEQAERQAAEEKEKAAQQKERAEKEAAYAKEKAEREAAKEKEQAAQQKERAEKQAAYAKEKAEREAKEVAEKQKKEAELAAYNQKLKTDPAFLYQERIKGAYAKYKGKLVSCEALNGKIMQVVSSKQILMSNPATLINGIFRNNTIAPVVSVVMDDTEGFIDDEPKTIQHCVRTGTFKYESVSGAVSTVAEYTVLAPVSYEDFLDLWNAKQLDVNALSLTPEEAAMGQLREQLKNALKEMKNQ